MIKAIQRFIGRFRKKTYVFSYGTTRKITVYARNVSSAQSELRSFFIREIYGDWALVYDESLINQEMQKTALCRSSSTIEKAEALIK